MPLVSKLPGIPFDGDYTIEIVPRRTESVGSHPTAARVRLKYADDRTYDLHVWTFSHLQKEKAENKEFLQDSDDDLWFLGPDFFVERIDEAAIKKIVPQVFESWSLHEVCRMDCRDPFSAKAFQLSKNKAIELQMSRWRSSPAFNFEWWHRGRGKDHPGFGFMVTVLWIEFSFSFYDIRHVEHFE